jgi:hypothetical protein
LWCVPVGIKAEEQTSAVLIAPEVVYQPGATTRPAVPATQPAPPATQPIDPKLKALIVQLGDENPRIREDAVAALRKFGKDALPALRGATDDQDPQIRTSAQALISQITDKDKPLAQADPNRSAIILRNGAIILHNARIQAGGNAQLQVRMQVSNGKSVREVTANENGRKVHIHEDNDGLKMQVTENGETKEYEAKNADDLKQKDPEAFKTYSTYTDNAGGAIQIQVKPDPKSP